MNGKRGFNPLLGCEQTGQISVDFTYEIVSARRVDSTAARVHRLRADKVVALLDCKDKKRIVLVDPMVGESLEELAECLIVVFQLLDIIRFTRTARRVDFA